MYAVPSENDFSKYKEIVNDDFLIFCGILLLLLHVGLSCMEASRVRSKFVAHIFLKIFLHIFATCFMYWLIGFGLSYTRGNFFLGLNWNSISTNETYEMPQWLYDNLVTATPVTIISGVMLERVNPIVFAVVSVIISGIAFPISTHWGWTTEGWLYQFGYRDFSGSGMVFAFAGIACFVVSLMMGPRKGRFNENSEVSPIYSSPLLGTGAILTVIGLLVFNCGSLYRLSNNVDGIKLNQIVQNTFLAGAGGCFVSLVVGRLRIQQSAWLLSNIINGTLTGMVAVCGAVNKYNGIESLITGIIAGLLFTALRYLLLLMKIDDPIDAFSVHFGGGVWGILAIKIFAQDGLLQCSDLSDSAWKILINFTGGMAICIWSVMWTVISTLVVKGVQKLIDNEDEDLQVNLSPNSFQDDSCYIEAIPYPYAINNDNKNTNDRDEYISDFNNSTLRVLKMDSNLYENLTYDMELQIRR